MERLQAAQGRAEALEGQLRGHSAQRAQVNMEGLERRLRAKLADWRELLRRNISEGRAVLRTLLIDPLRFTPVKDERRGYAFEGAIALDRLLTGVIELPTVMASPTGARDTYEPGSADTYELPLNGTVRKVA